MFSHASADHRESCPPSPALRDGGPVLDVFQVGAGWLPERKGGIESVFFQLWSRLGEQGIAQRGLVSGTGAAERDTDGRLCSFPLAGRSMVQRTTRIRALAGRSFAERRPDVVASHFALHTLPFLDRLRGVPLVTHFHGPWALESRVEGASRPAVAAKKLIETLVYRRSARFIVASEAFKQVLLNGYRVPDEVIRVIPLGVDCDRLDPDLSREEARRRLGWHADRPTLFTVRRLVRRMGLDRLLTAWDGIRRGPAGRDAVLHIGGTGPERDALQRQVAELGLGSSVFLDGFIAEDALPVAFRAADLTLVPTAALEGFGLVAAESLAAGTPVLVTPVGGLPEVVSGLSAAMVLGGTDAGSIAAGIEGVLREPSLMPSAGECRAHARRAFGWDSIAPRIAAVYREAR